MSSSQSELTVESLLDRISHLEQLVTELTENFNTHYHEFLNIPEENNNTSFPKWEVPED